MSTLVKPGAVFEDFLPVRERRLHPAILRVVHECLHVAGCVLEPQSERHHPALEVRRRSAAERPRKLVLVCSSDEDRYVVNAGDPRDLRDRANEQLLHKVVVDVGVAVARVEAGCDDDDRR